MCAHLGIFHSTLAHPVRAQASGFRAEDVPTEISEVTEYTDSELPTNSWNCGTYLQYPIKC